MTHCWWEKVPMRARSESEIWGGMGIATLVRSGQGRGQEGGGVWGTCGLDCPPVRAPNFRPDSPHLFLVQQDTVPGGLSLVGALARNVSLTPSDALCFACARLTYSHHHVRSRPQSPWAWRAASRTFLRLSTPRTKAPCSFLQPQRSAWLRSAVHNFSQPSLSSPTSSPHRFRMPSCSTP